MVRGHKLFGWGWRVFYVGRVLTAETIKMKYKYGPKWA